MATCSNPVPLSINRYIQDDYPTPLKELDTYRDFSIENSFILAPCGKCFICRKKRVSQWTLRLTHEYQSNYSDTPMYFVTLTYNNDNFVNPSLNISDVQKYIKRVRIEIHRKSKSKRPIKYLLVGEYGFKSMRKHFHIIFLGVPKKFAYLLEEKWYFGFSSVKYCNVNTVRYLLKYSFKQHFINPSEYKKLGLYPPFFSCSKGFGLNYLLNPTVIERLLELRYFCDNDRIYGIPRYYRKKMVEYGIVHYLFFCADVYDFYVKDMLISTLKTVNAPPDIIQKFKCSSAFDRELANCYIGFTHYYNKVINDKNYGKFLNTFREKI